MAADAYGLTARFYDLVVEPMNAPLRAAARRFCPPQSEWVVLDVGCGTGTALAEYRDAGCRVIGVDPSPGMLERARTRLGPQADLRLIEGAGLPVDDGCADLVLVSLVLHSVAHDEAVGILREAARALAPGGRVLVTDFGTSGLRFPRGWITRGVSAVAELAAGREHASHSLAYVRSGGLLPLVTEAGLAVQAMRPTAGGGITIAVLEAPPG
jgi:ubiquinone/menaquinone biosynthesis C-methylase UbiE